MALPTFNQVNKSSTADAVSLLKQAGTHFDTAMTSFGDVVDESVQHQTKKALRGVRQIEDLDELERQLQETDTSWVDTNQFHAGIKGQQ